MSGRTRGQRGAIALLGFIAFAVFTALGTWQVQRRTWKLELIERVEQRAHAEPVDAPGPERWPAITAESDAYRRVQARGQYRDADTVFVQAVTELGAGFWVLTPLERADGSTVFVNRGFVAPEVRERVAREAGPVSVTGLLRIGEPGGGFLRRNDAAANRWFSRDVAAIAAARGLRRVAPYFIDAGAAPNATSNAIPNAIPNATPNAIPTASANTPPNPTSHEKSSARANAPVGGLTVIAFSNSHAVYAFTWYTLALMTAAAVWWLMRGERVGRSD